MVDLALRPATPDDVPAIEALVEAAYRPWVALIGAEPGPLHDDYAAFTAQGLVQVLDGANGIEAILVLIPQPDAMLLDNVAVLPTAQGHGFGKSLMKEAERAALANGYTRLRLYTHEKMASNITRYERAGFKITQRIRERGLNRVYMEKQIG